MMVKEGNEYCGEHGVIKVEEAPMETREDNCGDNTRIFCPYDPKHTCSKRRLKRHLNACPARPQSMPKYHTKGLNTEGSDDCTSRTKRTINDISEERLANLVSKVNAVFKHLAALPAEHLSHPVVPNEAESGAAARKHLSQNSSLVRHLEEAGLTDKPSIFVEFGSGRGQLTYWLTMALAHAHVKDQDPTNSTSRPVSGNNISKHSEFVLVDRGSQRHKMDNKLKNEFQANELSTTRIKIDIADLSLQNVPLIEKCNGEKSLVALSKHLCGCATDLALRCLANSGLPVKGLCIACCCHHRCEWNSYVAKAFITDECGFHADDFFYLTRMTTWATCGDGRPREAAPSENSNLAPSNSDSSLHNPDVTPTNSEEIILPIEDRKEPGGSRYERLGLDSASDRAEVGWRVKRIFDEGRVRFARDVLGLENARLLGYCPKSVSPENVLLIASKGNIAK